MERQGVYAPRFLRVDFANGEKFRMRQQAPLGKHGARTIDKEIAFAGIAPAPGNAVGIRECEEERQVPI